MNYKTAEYDYEASSYDKSRFSSRLGRHLDYMHKRIVGSFLHSSAKLVLDVGVGTGRFATWLAEKGFEIIGVDVSTEMLKKAKRKAQIMHTDIGLILADMHFLPFRTGLFDGCICINVIDHVSNVSKFLKEVRYVIRPEGFLIFNFSNLQSPYLLMAIIVNLRKRALFKGERIQSRWSTLGEVNALLSRDGFDIMEIRSCFIASPLPLGDKLVNIIQGINFSIENSRLKLFSGSLFVKAQIASHSVSS